jgi:hypothetical protein
MKNFELIKETESWKEVVPYQFTNEQLAFLNNPTTEENKDAKMEMILEVQAASKLAVDAETTALLNAEYELQKSKIKDLALDYKLTWASFKLDNDKFFGVIYCFNNNAAHTHDFYPTV